MPGFEVFSMMGTIAINKEQVLKDIQAVKEKAKGASVAMGRSFDKFGKYMKDHSAQFRKAGIAMSIAGGIIALAVKTTGDAFDKYETKLVDMAKVTDESLEIIEERIRELPAILGSGTELLAGYYQVISAGIKDTSEALNVLRVGAETASAAHMSQSEVIKGLTKVMAGYEGQIKDVSEAADLMFVIEKEGQTTVAELIPVIGGLAKLSHDLGVSQNEMGASMAVVTKTAAGTADAATQLEGVLIALFKPTEMMKVAIRDMGFATAELAIKELGFVEVLSILKEGTKGNSEAMAELFGRKQALMGMSALTAKQMTVLRDTIVSVEGKAGSAAKAFEEWSQTGEAFNKTFKSVAEGLKVAIGYALDPMMDKLQIRMTEIVGAMLDWTRANPGLTRSIATWIAKLGGVLLVLGPLAIVLPSIVTGITLMAASFSSIIAIGALTAVIVGIMKLATWLRETVGGMREFREELGKMELREVDEKIQSLTSTLEELEKRFYKISKGIGRQEILTMMDEIEKRLDLLNERREELIFLTEEGIELSYDEIKAREEIAARIKEEEEKIRVLLESREDEISDIAELLEGSKKLSGQMMVLAAKYELTNKTLDDTSEHYQDLLVLSEELVEVLEIEKTKTKEGTLERQEAVLMLLAAQKGVKDLKEVIEELTKVEKIELEGLDLITAKMSILAAEYELTNKTIEDTNTHYQNLLDLSEELVKVLETEREKVEEGTVERQDANLALLVAQKRVKDLKEAIEELTRVEKTELEGLDLVAAKMSILEEKYRVVEKDAGYYGEKIKLLNEEHKLLVESLDKVIKKYGEGTAEYYKASIAIIANKNEIRSLGEILVEVPLTAWEKWNEFFNNMKENTKTTTEILQSAAERWSTAVGGAFESAITSLLNWKKTNEQVQEDLVTNQEDWDQDKIDSNESYKESLIAALAEYEGAKELSNWTLAQMEEKLKEDNLMRFEEIMKAKKEKDEAGVESTEWYRDALIAALEKIVGQEMLTVQTIAELEEALKESSKLEYESLSQTAQDEIAKIDDKYDELKTSIEEKQVTLASIWKDFWEELSSVAIRELAKIIAQQAISVLLSWGWAGWLLLGLAAIYALISGVGKATGGEVEKLAKTIAGYDIGGLVKGFAAGGGTDTVLTALTPGEYVVSKPMTDFIKRTGIVTSDLINAIRTGARTPIPSFAVGGAVPSVVSNPISNQINIEEISVSIYAQELNDETIASAGGKMLLELRKRLRMEGSDLLEV